MEALVNFLMENFSYVAFIIILLVLALVGYIVDTKKTNKLKDELTNVDDGGFAPLASIDPNVKLGSAVNKVTNSTTMGVNPEATEPPVAPANNTTPPQT